MKSKMNRRRFFELMGAGVAGVMLGGCEETFSTAAKNALRPKR